jgi:mRNA interferase RelE/StbE
MFRVEFLPEALEDLKRLDRAVVHRVFKKLRWLSENFDSLQPEGLSGPLAGLLKLRVGDYRVLYEAKRTGKRLTVHLVGHRRDIYKSRE